MPCSPIKVDIAFTVGFSLLPSSLALPTFRRLASFSAISAAAVNGGAPPERSGFDERGDWGAPAAAVSGVRWRLRGLEGRTSCVASAKASMPDVLTVVGTVMELVAAGGTGTVAGD
jgi:hypothetical protein